MSGAATVREAAPSRRAGAHPPASDALSASRSARARDRSPRTVRAERTHVAAEATNLKHSEKLGTS